MSTPARTAALLEDVSLHGVWWRPRWVVSWGDPIDFEEQRPWTHRIRPQVSIPIVLAATILSVVAVAIWLPLALLIYAPVIGLATLGAAAAVVYAELTFYAWVRGNDDRRLHDYLLPPVHLHPQIAETPEGIEAMRVIVGSRKLLERYVRMHAAKLRGWRRYGMDRPWLRLAEVADPEPVERFITAVTAFRESNDAVGERGIWDHEFAAIEQASEPQARRLGTTRTRRAIIARQEREAASREGLATQVLDAARTLRLALDDAATVGLSRITGTVHGAVRPAKRAAEAHYGYDGVNPFVVLAMVAIGVVIAGAGVLSIGSWVGDANEIVERQEHTTVPGNHEECVARGLTVEECMIVHGEWPAALMWV